MRIAIALGGNQGEVSAVFAKAVELLRDGGVSRIRLARPIVTVAEGCHPGTPDFLNTALVGEWTGTPLDLLALTQGIERRMGRPAEHDSRASRPLDLDILLLDETSLELPALVVPHPRMRRRRFVLEPLAEIAPNWRVPPTGETVAQLLAQLGT
ncbi:MAG: 2-amino-4-hydroxy-6-hydroxymethyldihydropteridine diphosphokinase [Victivallales bacterium]|nr:2-amino-4-hydroxy-6-hydroxymethyldihydropteridine diphosphokinase [Victivallales bacterium]